MYRRNRKNETSFVLIGAKIIYLLLPLVLFLNSNSADKAYGATVETIKIKSISHRFHQGKEACDYEIRRTANGYKPQLAVLDIIRNKQTLDPAQEKNYQHSLEHTKQVLDVSSITISSKSVEEFVDTINAPPYEKLDLRQLGITKEWLVPLAKRKIDTDTKNYSIQDIPDVEFYKSYHLKRLTDLEFTHRRLKYYFDSVWWHDDPSITVEILFDNGETIKLSSIAKHMYMVPWTIEKNNKTITNYNVEISKALGKLLHPKCANHYRVHVDLAKAIEQIVWKGDIRKPWHSDLSKTLRSLKTLGDEVSSIKQEFRILESYIRTKEYTGKDDQWTAKLNHQKWPSNLAVNYSTVIENGKPNLGDYFPEAIKKIGDKVLTVPWLAQYIREHPFYLFSIEYEKGLSLTQSQYSEIMQWFHELPNGEWMNQNYPYSEEVVLIIVSEEMKGFSKWLIFPDKTMALAGYLGNKAMKWTTRKEITYVTFIEFLGPTGIRVSPEGELLNP